MYLIRTDKGSDIETRGVSFRDHGIDYMGGEDLTQGFIPYSSINRVEMGDNDLHMPKVGIRSTPSQKASTSSDDVHPEPEGDTSEDTTEDDSDDVSRLQQCLEDDDVEAITLSELEDEVDKESDLDVLKEAQHKDPRKGAQDIYADRIDEVND